MLPFRYSHGASLLLFGRCRSELAGGQDWGWLSTSNSSSGPSLWDTTTALIRGTVGYSVETNEATILIPAIVRHAAPIQHGFVDEAELTFLQHFTRLENLA